MQPDPRFKFHARTVGENKTRFLVLSAQPIEIEVLPGVRVLVTPAAKDDLIKRLQSEDGKSLAAEWGVSESLVFRLRKGLGLARSYPGDSRVTQWRRTTSEDS